MRLELYDLKYHFNLEYFETYNKCTVSERIRVRLRFLIIWNDYGVIDIFQSTKKYRSLKVQSTTAAE